MADVRDAARVLDGITRQPAQGRTLEALGLGLTDRHANGQGITEVDAGKLGMRATASLGPSATA